MGKYSGKVLTVYIAQSGVRICEGENKDGNPDISKFFTVSGVSEYFSDAGNGRVEIINMSGLVSAIVSECKNRNTTARRVMVCSDCFGIDTTVSLDDSVGGLKNILTGDLKSLKSSGKNKDKPQQLPDKMVCTLQWGELIMDGAVKKMGTSSVGDKYMLKSLMQEFYTHGYEVVYASGAQEVLFNFIQTEPSSFDSQGKVIFDYDVFCGASVFVKDIPVDISRLPMLDTDSIPERLHAQLNQALQKTGRNPKVYLTGAAFANTRLYNQLIDELENDGYVVYDLFKRPEVGDDYEQQLAAGEVTPILTPDYSANIAMLMCAYTKTLISMTPTLDASDIFKKNSKTLVTLFLGLSIACLLVTTALAGQRLYCMYKMSSEPSNLMNLQNSLMSLSTRQQSLNSTIQTLTQADTTVLELLKFIDVNQNDRVSVVSIDTRDMLTDELSVDTSDVGLDPNAVTVDGTAGGGTGGSRESIIIRGYAKTGSEAVSYYNRLFKLGLSGDPVLNGVERYTLPGGDEVYVFEIEIGGDE